MDDLPVLPFPTAGDWDDWLASNGATAAGVFVKMAKKGTGVESIDYPQALDVALCHGWIDGLKLPFDEVWWLQRFTPRRPRSRWSKINCEKVEALIAAGRMRLAGQREVDAARTDGRWEAAYFGQGSIEVPPDLRAALDANPRAAAFFATLTGANRYAVLYRIQDAKRPQTRAARIEKYVAMLAAHETLH